MSSDPAASWLDDVEFDAAGSWLAMGTRSLGERTWLTGVQPASELALRAELLTERFDEVVSAPDSAAEAVDELVDMVVSEMQLSPPVEIDSPLETGPADQLRWLGRSVVEDFCLLRRGGREWVFEAGVVYFPSRWRLTDKVGSPLRAVHGPVDGYDPVLADRVTSLLDRLADRVVIRRNWFVHADPTLFQPDRPVHEPFVAAGAVLDGLHLRSERQTLRRMPVTGRVVFAITTQQCSLRTLVDDPGRRDRFSEFLRRAPADQIEHRGMPPKQVAAVLDALDTIDPPGSLDPLDAPDSPDSPDAPDPRSGPDSRQF